MKRLFSILLLITLFSCTENGSGNTIIGETNYTIVVIDGCEYLKRYEGYQSGYTFSHKGNCKNHLR